jgi:hypothetical protein
MQHNFALPAGELRFVDYPARFGDKEHRIAGVFPAPWRR